MKKRIRRFWNRVDSLDDKIYYAIALCASAATFGAFLLGVWQGLHPVASITTLTCCLWMLALLIIGIRRPKSLPACRIVLVCGLNVLMVPAYFSCGALSGGMILYYELSLFLTAVLLHDPTRIYVFFGSFALLLTSIIYGYHHPELVNALTPRQGYEDIIVTFCMTAPALVVMTAGILNAYSAERRHNEVLVEQLSELSVRDALSGLYNRREMFRRLELIYQPRPETRADHLKLEGCCLALFDIDDFKLLNDTHGHQFGDLVLSTVSQTLDAAMRHERGEFAARYGGEEFVCVIYSERIDDAFARLDAVRQGISELRWSAVPGLRVTVSGGLVVCADKATLDQAVHDADVLLYEAKHTGKNRLVCTAK